MGGVVCLFREQTAGADVFAGLKPIPITAADIEQQEILIARVESGLL